ncbi:MAG: arginine repressor [Selenomonadales bacterium]|nr:arginine repressor [Selenomonadales bacterium]
MKEQRQARILEIVTRQEVETQEELGRLLEAEGHKATQATVSRDIKELGLIKVQGRSGRQVYIQSPGNGSDNLTDRLVRILRNAVTGIDYTGNLVVLKTFAGGGNAAAAALDSLELEGVMGTIAGDDTILLIAREASDTPALVDRLGRMLVLPPRR